MAKPTKKITENHPLVNALSSEEKAEIHRFAHALHTGVTAFDEEVEKELVELEHDPKWQAWKKAWQQKNESRVYRA